MSLDYEHEKRPKMRGYLVSEKYKKTYKVFEEASGRGVFPNFQPSFFNG